MKWHQTQASDMDIGISIRARVGIGHRQGISRAINKVPRHWQTRQKISMGHGHRWGISMAISKVPQHSQTDGSGTSNIY